MCATQCENAAEVGRRCGLPAAETASRRVRVRVRGPGKWKSDKETRRTSSEKLLSYARAGVAAKDLKLEGQGNVRARAVRLG